VNFIEHISYPYKPRSHDPILIFGPLDICTVNHRPLVGLCLDSNEDRATREHFANLDQMAKCFLSLVHTAVITSLRIT